MFCKACGRNNPEGQLTCFSCGAPLNADDGAQAQFQPGMNPQAGGFGQPAAQNAYTPAPTRGFSFAAPTANKTNYFAIIGAVILVIGVFLPFWIIELNSGFFKLSESYSMFTDNHVRGIISIVMGVTCITSALKNVNSGVIASGAVGLLMGILEYTALDKALAQISDSPEAVKLMEESCHTGAGCAVVFIGAAVILISGIIGKLTENK